MKLNAFANNCENQIEQMRYRIDEVKISTISIQNKNTFVPLIWMALCSEIVASGVHSKKKRKYYVYVYNSWQIIQESYI